MKYMVASDIHGSGLYCEMLMERYKEEKPDKLILLGDILYHGPRNALPDEYNTSKVIDLLNEISENIICVHGNCDSEVDQMVLSFPITLAYYTFEIGGKTVFATHGHVYNNDNLPQIDGKFILLHGHTHVSCCETYDTHTYMNPGSVSIPKENTPRGYMIIDDNDFTWKTLSGEVYRTVF